MEVGFAPRACCTRLVNFDFLQEAADFRALPSARRPYQSPGHNARVSTSYEYGGRHDGLRFLLYAIIELEALGVVAYFAAAVGRPFGREAQHENTAGRQPAGRHGAEYYNRCQLRRFGHMRARARNEDASTARRHTIRLLDRAPKSLFRHMPFGARFDIGRVLATRQADIFTTHLLRSALSPRLFLCRRTPRPLLL